METQAEDKVSAQQPELDKVLEKINQIVKKSATGDYIYRGEPAHYKEPPYCGRVTSGIYRQDLDIGAEHFNIEVTQQQILTEAREYIPDEMGDFELLATLQHYGDKTNLIDFTTDYLVALFFACDGEPEKPGRVILLQRHPESDAEPYEVKKPPRTIRRAEAQKSIFVRAEKGFVEPDKVVCIPGKLKAALLDYLRKHHDISTKTIYNDLHGFIEKRRLHRRVYTEFYKGCNFQRRADAAKTNKERQKLCEDAIAHYTKAIDLKPDLTQAYNHRGLAYADIDDFDAAIEDYSKAIDLESGNAAVYYNNRGLTYLNKGDFDAAIEDLKTAINLIDFAGFYYNRGQVWLHLKAWEQAKADLTTAKDMGIDIVASFHNVFGSIEAFEAKLGVNLPEDITALLQRK